jgi:hypothetical protein
MMKKPQLLLEEIMDNVSVYTVIKTGKERAVVIFILVIFFLPIRAIAETIYLKDGQILKGSIVDENSKTIFLKTRYHTRKIYRDHILRIMYGNRDLESVYLHLKDGSLINGFLVDQDSEKIIFRTEKNSPDEKTILKSNIRQISGEEIKLLYPDISFSAGIYYPVNSGGAALSPAPVYFAGSGFNFTPIDNSRILFEIGYTKSRSSENSGRAFQFIPLTVNALYSIQMSSLNIVPRAGVGAAMVSFDDGEGGEYTGYDFTASLGAGIDYIVKRYGIRITIITEYNVILEGTETLGSLILRAGFNYRF